MLTTPELNNTLGMATFLIANIEARDDPATNAAQ
jgi:hypothetical protein